MLPAGSLLLMLITAMAATAQEAGRPDAVLGTGEERFALATGSPGELGLLAALAETFARENNATIVWYRRGSGQAMDLLKARKVDMVLAHAPAAERKAVAEGWAAGRRLIGSNEFWVVGPKEDPAEIAQAKDAADAFRRIRSAEAKFVSRGDTSGTHQKEKEIWTAASVLPGGWAGYIATRDFMTASLKRADAEGAYFLSDSSTFVVERTNTPRLKVLFRGGGMLLNPYHALYLAEATPATPLARKFGEFVASDRGQAMIREFGRSRYGEAMYNDAAATAKLMP